MGGGNDGLAAVGSVTAAVWLVQARSVWPQLAKAQEFRSSVSEVHFAAVCLGRQPDPVRRDKLLTISQNGVENVTGRYSILKTAASRWWL